MAMNVRQNCVWMSVSRALTKISTSDLVVFFTHIQNVQLISCDTISSSSLLCWSFESLAVSFCLMASQWEQRFTLPFPSCFLYNPKFPANQLLGLQHAFTLVSCLAYSALKMEVIYSSETLVDFR
jgi:hypothetical protein